MSHTTLDYYSILPNEVVARLCTCTPTIPLVVIDAEIAGNEKNKKIAYRLKCW